MDIFLWNVCPIYTIPQCWFAYFSQFYIFRCPNDLSLLYLPYLGINALDLNRRHNAPQRLIMLGVNVLGVSAHLLKIIGMLIFYC